MRTHSPVQVSAKKSPASQRGESGRVGNQPSSSFGASSRLAELFKSGSSRRESELTDVQREAGIILVRNFRRYTAHKIKRKLLREMSRTLLYDRILLETHMLKIGIPAMLFYCFVFWLLAGWSNFRPSQEIKITRDRLVSLYQLDKLETLSSSKEMMDFIAEHSVRSKGLLPLSSAFLAGYDKKTLMDGLKRLSSAQHVSEDNMPVIGQRFSILSWLQPSSCGKAGCNILHKKTLAGTTCWRWSFDRNMGQTWVYGENDAFQRTHVGRPENNNTACIEDGTAYVGTRGTTKIHIAKASSPQKNAEVCQQLCQQEAHCNLFSYFNSTNECFLHEADSTNLRVFGSQMLSGPRYCAPADAKLSALHLFTLVIDGDELRIYWDEKLVSEQRLLQPVTDCVGELLAGDPDLFAGEINFFPKALSAQDVVDNVAAGKPLFEVVAGTGGGRSGSVGSIAQQSLTDNSASAANNRGIGPAGMVAGVESLSAGETASATVGVHRAFDEEENAVTREEGPGCYLKAGDVLRLKARGRTMAFKFDEKVQERCQSGDQQVPGTMVMVEDRDDHSVWSQLIAVGVPWDKKEERDETQGGFLRNLGLAAFKVRYLDQYVHSVHEDTTVCASTPSRLPETVFRILLADPAERWNTSRVLRGGDLITLSPMEGSSRQTHLGFSPDLSGGDITLFPTACHEHDAECVAQCAADPALCAPGPGEVFEMEIPRRCRPAGQLQPVVHYASLPYPGDACSSHGFPGAGCSCLDEILSGDANSETEERKGEAGPCSVPHVRWIEALGDQMQPCTNSDDCGGTYPRHPQAVRDVMEAASTAVFSPPVEALLSAGDGQAVPTPLPTLPALASTALCGVANPPMGEEAGPDNAQDGETGRSCNYNQCRHGALGPEGVGARANVAFKYDVALCVEEPLGGGAVFDFQLRIDASSWFMSLDGTIVVDRTHLGVDTYGRFNYTTPALSVGIHQLNLFAIENCCSGCDFSGWKLRRGILREDKTVEWGEWVPWSSSALGCSSETAFGGSDVPRLADACRDPVEVADDLEWVDSLGRGCEWAAAQAALFEPGVSAPAMNPCASAETSSMCPVACRRLHPELVCNRHTPPPSQILSSIHKFESSLCLNRQLEERVVAGGALSGRLSEMLDATCGFKGDVLAQGPRGKSYGRGDLARSFSEFTLVGWVLGEPTIVGATLAKGSAGADQVRDCFAIASAARSGTTTGFFFSDNAAPLHVELSAGRPIRKDRWHLVGVGWNSTHAFVSWDGRLASAVLADFSCPNLAGLQLHGTSVSPLRFVRAGLSLSELQSIYYAERAKWQGSSLQQEPPLTGPMASSREQVTLRNVTLARYSETIVSVMPPLILQTRRESLDPSDPACDQALQSALAYSYASQMESICSNSMHRCVVPQLACYGEEIKREDVRFFGRRPQLFLGRHVFTDFLYMLDSPVVVRDQEEHLTDGFIDGASREVSLLSIYLVTGSKPPLALFLDVTFTVLPGKITGRYTFREMVSIEGERAQLAMAMAILALIFVLCTVFVYLFHIYSQERLRRQSQKQDWELPVQELCNAFYLLSCAAYCGFWIYVIKRSEPEFNKNVNELGKLAWFQANTRFGEKLEGLYEAVEGVANNTSQEARFRLVSFLMGWSILVRTILYMELHPRTGLFVHVLRRCQNELMHFVIYAGVIFVIMAFIANFMFGNTEDSFDTVTSTLVKQWNLLNGLDPVLKGNHSIYLAYFGVLFTGLVVYFMLNFLLAIIVDAYQDEKKMVEEQVVEFSIWEDILYVSRTAFLRWWYCWPSNVVILRQLRARQGLRPIQSINTVLKWQIATFPTRQSAESFVTHFYRVLKKVELQEGIVWPPEGAKEDTGLLKARFGVTRTPSSPTLSSSLAPNMSLNALRSLKACKNLHGYKKEAARERVLAEMRRAHQQSRRNSLTSSHQQSRRNSVSSEDGLRGSFTTGPQHNFAPVRTVSWASRVTSGDQDTISPSPGLKSYQNTASATEHEPGEERKRRRASAGVSRTSSRGSLASCGEPDIPEETSSGDGSRRSFEETGAEGDVRMARERRRGEVVTDHARKAFVEPRRDLVSNGHDQSRDVSVVKLQPQPAQQRSRPLEELDYLGIFCDHDLAAGADQEPILTPGRDELSLIREESGSKVASTGNGGGCGLGEGVLTPRMSVKQRWGEEDRDPDVEHSHDQSYRFPNGQRQGSQVETRTLQLEPVQRASSPLLQDEFPLKEALKEVEALKRFNRPVAATVGYFHVPPPAPGPARSVTVSNTATVTLSTFPGSRQTRVWQFGQCQPPDTGGDASVLGDRGIVSSGADGDTGTLDAGPAGWQ